jgi:hypothetical protein
MYALILGWASFWVIFSQTHLLTLPVTLPVGRAFRVS